MIIIIAQYLQSGSKDNTVDRNYYRMPITLKTLIQKMAKLFVKRHLHTNGDGDAFKGLEIFFHKAHFLKSHTFDDFTRIKFIDKRLIIIVSLKILSIIFLIRCVLNILWPTSYIRNLTCNAYHYLGDPTLINLVFLSSVITANLIFGGCISV